MKVEFSEKEMKEAAKIKKTVKELYKLQGIEDKEAEYHYELHLGSIGSTIYMVVPEFNIRVNITDYNKW